MSDEVADLKNSWIAAVLNLLLPGAGYLYVGDRRFWSIVLIVGFSALTYVLYGFSMGWFIASLVARVIFAIHAGRKANAQARSVMDPSYRGKSHRPHGDVYLVGGKAVRTDPRR